MLWGESLTNPLLKFTDLKAVAKIAKQKVKQVRHSQGAQIEKSCYIYIFIYLLQYIYSTVHTACVSLKITLSKLG